MVFPSRAKVLLVEDDDDTRTLLAELLADDFDVSTSADGASALTLLEKGDRPTVLVTDESLPGLKGSALARTVKRRWPDVRVVLVSGFNLGKADAVDAVLNKPVDLDELSRVLEDLSVPTVH
jgi:CheY-like chemotaxis protein